MASTPAAQVRDIAGTLPWCGVRVLIARATTDPIAAPVANAGVSMPPTAPARRNAAVRRGLRNRTTTAEPKVRPLAKLTVRMLLPLPGRLGHHTEQMPINNPAAAIAGISTHDLMG